MHRVLTPSRPSRSTVGTLVLLAATVWTGLVLEADRRRADRRYLREVHAENRRRGLATHRYRPVDVPARYTWDVIRLCIQAEAMGSTRYAAGYTS